MVESERMVEWEISIKKTRINGSRAFHSKPEKEFHRTLVHVEGMMETEEDLKRLFKKFYEYLIEMEFLN